MVHTQNCNGSNYRERLILMLRKSYMHLLKEGLDLAVLELLIISVKLTC